MNTDAKKKKKRVRFALFTICISVLMSLSFVEIAARVFLPPAGQKVYLTHGDTVVHCYPTDPDSVFPLDISKPGDLKKLFEAIPDPDKGKAALLPTPGSDRKHLPAEPLEVHLKQNAPHCIVYNISDSSPRRISFPDRWNKTLALIGDSFAYGQGVVPEKTFGAVLGRLKGIRVVNYGNMGANLEQVVEQFQLALEQKEKYRFSQILYLYVLDDPIMSLSMRARQSQLCDMAWGKASLPGPHMNAWEKLSDHLARYFKIGEFFRSRANERKMTRETIRWYEKVYSEQNSPFIFDTFSIIGQMEKKARREGLDFALVVYPLMGWSHGYPLEQVHQVIGRLCERNKITKVDLLPEFLRHAGENLIVHHLDRHPNAAAHDIAARATVQALSSLGHGL